MELGNLYQFVLLLVLVSILIGVSVLVLDMLSTTTGITNAAVVAINASRDAISGIATIWMALIVTIAILGIILTIVIRSFGAKR